MSDITDDAVREALKRIDAAFGGASRGALAAFLECFGRPLASKLPLSHRCPYSDAAASDERPECPAATGEERVGLCSFSRSEYGAALAATLNDPAYVRVPRSVLEVAPGGPEWAYADWLLSEYGTTEGSAS